MGKTRTIEDWQKIAENRRRQASYWKDKAKNREYSEIITNIMEADPEFKWFILWLGAGAVEQVTRGGPFHAFSPEAKKQNQAESGFKIPDTGFDFVDEAFERVEEEIQGLPKLGLTDLAVGSISPAFLIARVLDWGLAGGLSATALAMIIIGRMDIDKLENATQSTLPVG